MQKKDGINKKSKNTKVVVRTFGWNLLIIFLLINSVILNKSHILCFCFTYMLYTGAGCHNIHLTHTEYLSPPVFRLYVLTSDHLLQESNWEKHKNKRTKKKTLTNTKSNTKYVYEILIPQVICFSILFFINISTKEFIPFFLMFTFCLSYNVLGAVKFSDVNFPHFPCNSIVESLMKNKRSRQCKSIKGACIHQNVESQISGIFPFIYSTAKFNTY